MVVGDALPSSSPISRDRRSAMWSAHQGPKPNQGGQAPSLQMEGAGHAAFRPRKMDVEVLVETLVKEHAVMRESFERAKGAAARGDLRAVSAELRGIDPVFRQHVADEEAQILGLLVRELGREGAAEAIRVFQQHRPIYQLMLKVRDLAARPSEALRESEAELAELFELHTRSEESWLFPKAASLGAARRPS